MGASSGGGRAAGGPSTTINLFKPQWQHVPTPAKGGKDAAAPSSGGSKNPPSKTKTARK